MKNRILFIAFLIGSSYPLYSMEKVIGKIFKGKEKWPANPCVEISLEERVQQDFTTVAKVTKEQRKRNLNQDDFIEIFFPLRTFFEQEKLITAEVLDTVIRMINKYFPDKPYDDIQTMLNKSFPFKEYSFFRDKLTQRMELYKKASSS